MKALPGGRSRIVVFAVGLIVSVGLGFYAGRVSSQGAVRGDSERGVGERATGTLIPTGSSTCDGTSERLTIVQDRADGPAGMVATWFEQEQAIAQTFTPPAAGLSLVEFAPTLNYAVGPGATVSIYAVDNVGDPMSGQELARSELSSSSVMTNEPARIRLDRAVPVECGGVYSIVIRPKPGAELGIQATAAGRTGKVYAGGAMFMGRPGRWLATGGDMRFEVVLVPATPS
jgi:hypothetical protein